MVNGFVEHSAAEDSVAGAVVAVDAVVNDATIAADAKLLCGDVAGGPLQLPSGLANAQRRTRGRWTAAWKRRQSSEDGRLSG